LNFKKIKIKIKIKIFKKCLVSFNFEVELLLKLISIKIDMHLLDKNIAATEDLSGIDLDLLQRAREGEPYAQLKIGNHNLHYYCYYFVIDINHT
jgi:hypothetical protein